jgi:hypothetical protein
MTLDVTRAGDVAPPSAVGVACVAQTTKDRYRLGQADSLSDNDRWRLLESWDPPRLKLRFRRAAGVLAIATVVVIFAMATKTESARAQTRATMVASSSTTPNTAPWMLPYPVGGEAPGRATMLAVPRPVLRAEIEKAAGWEGAPSGDVVPSQTVEAETNE